MFLLERDLLALEGAASTTATTTTAVTESTTSTTTSTEAATSAAVSEATAASTATSTAAAESTTTAATATTAIVWSAAGKVQANSTTLEVCTLELFDNLLGILDGVEGDVTETLETSGFPEGELAWHKNRMHRRHNLLLCGQAKALDLRNLGEES